MAATQVCTGNKANLQSISPSIKKTTTDGSKGINAGLGVKLVDDTTGIIEKQRRGQHAVGEPESKFEDGMNTRDPCPTAEHAGGSRGVDGMKVGGNAKVGASYSGDNGIGELDVLAQNVPAVEADIEPAAKTVGQANAKTSGEGVAGTAKGVHRHRTDPASDGDPTLLLLTLGRCRRSDENAGQGGYGGPRTHYS